MTNKWLVRIGLIIGILVLIGAMLEIVNNRIDSVLSPLRQVNNQLGTQVSNFLHPTPTIIPDPVTIINQVQAIAKLETVHYTIEKIVTAETGQGVLAPLFGDRLLFVAHGFVIAGIDMSKIVPEDMWLEGGELHVRLPQAEVLVYSLDNQKSYIYDRQTGLFTHGDSDLETQARQVAEQEILNSALADGILDQAAINAQSYLSLFFENLGYQNIVFVSSAQ
jgi:hypothetical protein